MTTSTKRLSLIAGAIAMIASTFFIMTPAVAADTSSTAQEVTQKSDFKGKRSKKGGMHKMLRKLNLTDTQKEQLKGITAQYRPQRDESMTKDERRTKNQAQRQEMLALIQAPTFDEAQATQMIEAKQLKHQQRMLHELKMQNAVYQILTPEQQEKFEFMLDNPRMKRGR